MLEGCWIELRCVIVSFFFFLVVVVVVVVVVVTLLPIVRPKPVAF